MNGEGKGWKAWGDRQEKDWMGGMVRGRAEKHGKIDRKRLDGRNGEGEGLKGMGR